MILPSNIVLSFLGWIASRLGLDLGFQSVGLVESLDEHEISSQLQHGRD